MSSSFGQNLRFSIFGESHSAAIGVNIEGLPAGCKVDLEELQAFLERRAPGRDETSTSRKEPDQPEFLSGLKNGFTTGSPIAAIIRNTNTRSQDYGNLAILPRPGHADYPAEVKFGGFQDRAGGGHFSGRLTAPLCIVGGIAIQLLKRLGITISAKANVDKETILKAKAEGDSVGGLIECEVVGCPAGLGNPMFLGMENRIAQVVFGIPAVKGLEFGAGFKVASMKGSENNDPYRMVDGKVTPITNNAGGILGGITTGAPIVFRVAIKPTPSIFKDQASVDLTKMEDATLSIKGRHDPCIALRAVPVVEAAAAVAILDAYLERRKEQAI